MRSSWEATEGGATRRVRCVEEDDDPAPVVMAGLKSDEKSRVMGDMVVDGGVVRRQSGEELENVVARFCCCYSGQQLGEKKTKV